MDVRINSPRTPISGHSNENYSFGRSNLTRSIIWSWAGHLVFLIAGFLLPRFIDRNIGQTMLGVWDFSWSLTGYFSIILLGVGSSVNRYVAMHLAEENVQGLNESISSVFFVQGIMGIVILIITALVIWIIPIFWSEKLGSLAPTARWLVFFLGFSLALSTASGAFDGVLTGCHRWDLYNSINSGSHAVGLIAMLIALLLGAGILWLGFIYLLETVLRVLIRQVVVNRVCPFLEVSRGFIKLSVAMGMLQFGGKTYANEVLRTILYQTNNILIMTYMGPMMLAVYSRPMHLVQHVRTLSLKLAHTITPVASEMEVAGDKKELGELVLKMARYNVAMALPPILFLCFLGGPLLLFWMGTGYQQDILIAILAAGHLLTIANQPLQTAMIGLNAHGRLAKFTFFATITSLILCYIALAFFNGGLISAAISIVAPLMVADGIFITSYACKKLNLPLRYYARKVWGETLLCVIPFVICLFLFRILLEPINALFCGVFIGGFVLLVIYWKWMMPSSLRARVVETAVKSSLIRRICTLQKN